MVRSVCIRCDRDRDVLRALPDGYQRRKPNACNSSPYQYLPLLLGIRPSAVEIRRPTGAVDERPSGSNHNKILRRSGEFRAKKIKAGKESNKKGQVYVTDTCLEEREVCRYYDRNGYKRIEPFSDS